MNLRELDFPVNYWGSASSRLQKAFSVSATEKASSFEVKRLWKEYEGERLIVKQYLKNSNDFSH